MAMSRFQKGTLAACLLLCAGLLLPRMLLPRGRREGAERPDGSGRLPPMMHRQMAPEGRGQRAGGSGFSRAHNPEAVARAKGGSGPGAGTGGKSNLAGQIIPVYGFGILLYILYILFKITSKGNSKPSESRFPSVRSENMKRKITDFELAQLQEKLRETELVMEKIVSNAHHSPDRVKGVTPDQEENLLHQLTEITRVMQESQMVENVEQEKKSPEDWEDYPEEPQTYWEHSPCCCQHGQQGERRKEEEKEEQEEKEEHVCDVTAGGEEVLQSEEQEVLQSERQEALQSEEQEVLQSERQEALQSEETGGGGASIDLGVPAEELAGLLQELELSLQLSSLMEQEKMDDLSRTTQPDASCSSSLRRRNRRRRPKKASQ